MAVDLTLNRNDKGFDITFTVLNKDKTPYDLTGHTIKFHISDKKYNKVLEGDCVITDAVNGVCTYTILVDNLTMEKGYYFGELQLSTVAGLILTNVTKLNIQIVEECG